MSLKQSITLLLQSENHQRALSKGAFEKTRDTLMEGAASLCSISSIEGCQNFIGLFFLDSGFDNGADGKVQLCFPEGEAKKTYDSLFTHLSEESWDRPLFIIANALISAYMWKLSERRCLAAEGVVDLLKMAERFAMHYPLGARKFVGNHGEILLPSVSSAGGVFGEITYATHDDLGVEMSAERTFQEAMGMCDDDQERAISLCVKAVDAVLHVYSDESLEEFANLLLPKKKCRRLV
jgi:hypothetical protein